MTSSNEVHDLQYFGLRPSVGADDVEKVYRNKERWNRLKDNHIFYFTDHTYGILKKFKSEDDTCQDVSVILPFKVPIFPDVDAVVKIDHRHLDCEDCANIMKVAKTDFRRGHLIEDNNREDTMYSFHFGQRVYDSEKEETAIVVGQTRCFAYVLTTASLLEDIRKGSSLVPIKRKIDTLQGMAARKALNYRVVKECAAMGEIVVHGSDSGYVLVQGLCDQVTGTGENI